MKCNNCGNIVPDNAKFCDKCGAKVEAAPVQPDIQQVNTANQNSNMSNKGIPVPKRAQGFVIEMIIAVAVIVVILIFVGIACGGKNKDAYSDFQGYTAALEKGNRLKSAVAHKEGELFCELSYDIGGRLTYAAIQNASSEEWEQIKELCSDKVPVYSDGFYLNESQELFKEAFLMKKGENYYTYDTYDGEVEVEWKSEKSVCRYRLDENTGKLTELTWQNEEGKWDEPYYYKYNADQRLSLILYGENESHIYYDDAGRVKYVEKKNDGEKEAIIEVAYDAEGRMTKKSESYKSWLDIMVGAEYSYEYDEAGRMIFLKGDRVGEQFEVSSVYEEDGSRTETTNQYDSDGAVKNTTVKQYGKDDKLLISEIYSVYGGTPYLTEKKEYSYDTSDGSLEKEKKSSYSYEANSDFSVVNQIEAKEGAWEYVKERKEAVVWELSYYSDEEWEQYQHDKEFTKLN